MTISLSLLLSFFSSFYFVSIAIGAIATIIFISIYRHFKKESAGILDRKKSKGQYEEEVGTEIQKLVNLVFLEYGGAVFAFFGLLRKRSIKLEKDGDESKQTHEYELVHPRVSLRKDRHPHFIWSDEDLFAEGTQIEFSKVPEGQRRSNRFARNMMIIMTVLINAILLVLELGAQPGSPFAYSYGLLRWYYIPVGEVILFLLLIYYVVKKIRGQTWVVNLIMAEIAPISKKEGRHFGVVVNGHTPLIEKLKRGGGVDAETLKKYAKVLSDTNAEEAAALKREIQTDQAVITGQKILIEKMNVQREASIVSGGTEIKKVMPKWAYAAMMSLTVGIVALLFLMFG